MRYLKVTWIHDDPEDPVELYSEIDDEGWEQRRVDCYASGRKDIVGRGVATGKTGLSDVPILETPEEIAEDPQFRAEPISSAQFEEAWGSAASWFGLEA